MVVLLAIVGAVCVHSGTTSGLLAQQEAGLPQDSAPSPSLSEGQYHFYSGRYERAAAIAVALRASDANDLASYELRTSAIHFQIKRAIGDAKDRAKALAQCPTCAALMVDFLSDISRGQTLARERLKADPADQAALFLLGKIDLNYVWLQLGTLGRKTGWNEYREGRRSLDAVLARDPAHVRARVGRAWIDYIVDTRAPRGTKWILGGGSRKRALVAVRQASEAKADTFVRAEAGFALWEMLVREKDIPAAVVTAQALAREFPENAELVTFLAAHDRASPSRAMGSAPVASPAAGLRP